MSFQNSKIDNIIVEEDPKILLELGFRPCKRCKPTQKKLPDDEWISQVTDYIDKHYQNKLSLEIIAENTHSSPYHLHRKFKEVNMKNKRMKLLFNWQQIETLYELQIKNYKRCKNLYNACDISKYNQRELLQYYFEIKCLAIKTNDRPLFNKCHDEMDKINSSSP